MSGSGRALLTGLVLVGAVGVGWYRWTVFKPDDAELSRPTLAVVTGGVSPYWRLIAGGAEAAGQDLNAEVQVLQPAADEDLESQMKLLLAMDLSKLDGVALSPLDAASQSSVINRLSMKTHVVTVDSDAPHANRLSYVGASNYGAGQLCAQLVAEAAPDGGQVVVLLANLTKDNMVERKRGFEDQLVGEDANGAPPYEIVEVLLDEGDADRCVRQLTEALAKHNDIACVVGMNAYHAPLLVQCVEAAGRSAQVRLIAFDAVAGTLDLVGEGKIYATVAQDPYQYGYQAVQKLCEYSRRKQGNLPLTGGKSTVNIPTKAIRLDDVEEFRKASDKQLRQLATP